MPPSVQVLRLVCVCVWGGNRGWTGGREREDDGVLLWEWEGQETVETFLHVGALREGRCSWMHTQLGKTTWYLGKTWDRPRHHDSSMQVCTLVCKTIFFQTSSKAALLCNLQEKRTAQINKINNALYNCLSLSFLSFFFSCISVDLMQSSSVSGKRTELTQRQKLVHERSCWYSELKCRL